MDSAPHHEIDFNLDLDTRASHQQLGFAGVGRRERVGLKTSCLQVVSRLPDGLIDVSQCFIARQAVVGEYKIQIDRQPWHVADEQVDRSAALERDSAIREDERRDLRQQASSVQEDVVMA